MTSWPARMTKKTEFNVNWPSKVIQCHVFWAQCKGDEGLNNVGCWQCESICNVYASVFENHVSATLDVQAWTQNLRSSHSQSFKPSRSRVLGSMESRRWTPYLYIIMLAISLKFPKIQSAKTRQIAVFDKLTVVWRPFQRIPSNIRINFRFSEISPLIV